MKKFSGIILVVLGALLLVFSYFADFVDYSSYNVGALLIIIIGIITHIIMYYRRKKMNHTKCQECGEIIDSSNTSCPNCGAPIAASEREKTDTGTADEATIRTYANVIWVVCVVLGIIGFFLSFALLEDSGGWSVVGIPGTIIFLLLAYVGRAFIRVFSNISINLHEINKKLH